METGRQTPAQGHPGVSQALRALRRAEVLGATPEREPMPGAGVAVPAVALGGPGLEPGPSKPTGRPPPRSPSVMKTASRLSGRWGSGASNTRAGTPPSPSSSPGPSPSGKAEGKPKRGESVRPTVPTWGRRLAVPAPHSHGGTGRWARSRLAKDPTSHAHLQQNVAPSLRSRGASSTHGGVGAPPPFPSPPLPNA